MVNPDSEIYFILSRASSGILNGGFYSKTILIGISGYVLTTIFTFLSIKQSNIRSKICLFLSLLSISFVLASFLFPPFILGDIHLWTLLTQTFQVGAMFFENPKKWWRLILLVTPAVFFQKFFVNILGGNKWYYQGTNVSSGKYYTIFNKVRIPRIFSGNMYFRLVMTIISLVTLKLTKKHGYG